MDYLSQVNDIYAQTGKLLKQHDQLRARCTTLENDNEQLHIVIKQQLEQIEELQHQLKLLRLAKQVTTGEDGDKVELRRKINEFIKEIDKCVALLNN